jgi:predicted nucleic acid-binding protein
MHWDRNHAASVDWMSKFIDAGGLLIAPTLLLIEVAAAIARQSGPAAIARQAAQSLQNVSEMRLIPLDATLVQESIDVAADLSLRAGDAVYVAVAQRMSIPLVSWDRQQLQRASTAVATCTPDTFPF